MPFAQGSRSGLAYVVESTYGVTPGSPTMVDLPFSGHSLNLNKELLESPDIRSDRMVSYARHGNRSVAGDISFALRQTDFDDILESAFFKQFTTAGVLDIGTTQQSLTIEDRQLDITQYRRFTGCVVSQLQVQMQVNATVNATATIVGSNMTTATSPLDASIDAGAGFDPFDTYNGVLQEGGSTIAIITGINFTIDNGVAPTYVLGSATTPQLEQQRARVSGTIDCYYQDTALITKFLNETESSLQVNCSRGSGTQYRFFFPRIKYNGAAVPVNNEQSRILSLPFIALRDSGTATELRLSKI